MTALPESPSTLFDAPPHALRAVPDSPFVELLLTLRTAASHHDPASTDKSNGLVFNRQKQLLPIDAGNGIDPLAADAFCRAHPVAGSVAGLFDGLSFSDFVGCAIVKLLIDEYGGGEGVGVFKGVERYALLETRLRRGAVRALHLRGLWDLVCADLALPLHGSDADAMLAALWSLPKETQRAVLGVIVRDYRSLVSLGRLWAHQDKLRDGKYAKAAKQEQDISESVVLTFASIDGEERPPVAVMDTPSLSSSSLRHVCVRDPSWRHLTGFLGLRAADRPGQGEMPLAVESIFANGGNIKSGAVQPNAPYPLKMAIRAAFPSLDLLGGTTDSFDVGASRLSVCNWLVCRENRDALAGTDAFDLPEARVSVWDMMDEVTATRHATERGAGQMIYNFETLCAGAKVWTRFLLGPWTPRLTQGALIAALETYLAHDPIVGGQKARGYGFADGEILRTLPGAHETLHEYETYLHAHCVDLRDWMIDGTMGSGTAVCS